MGKHMHELQAEKLQEVAVICISDERTGLACRAKSLLRKCCLALDILILMFLLSILDWGAYQ